MSLFHPNDSDSDQWVMDMHVILHILTMSQWLITNKMFVHSTMVSWRYMKQTIVATSSNHTKLRGKLWICLAKVYNSTCARNLWLSPTKMESTTIYENNSVLFNWKDDIDIQKFIHVKIWQVYLWSFAKKNFWANDIQVRTLSP